MKSASRRRIQRIGFALLAVLFLGVSSGCGTDEVSGPTTTASMSSSPSVDDVVTTTTTEPDLGWINDVLDGVGRITSGGEGGAGSVGSTTCAPRTTPARTGFDTLMIGHSFFVPVAERLGRLAPAVGLGTHRQTTVFSGGATGAPQALWDAPGKRSEIQSALDTGQVELFGMTYHPDHPGLDGYRLWVDYALARNPQTMFFIAMPWLTDPTTMDAQTYVTTWENAHLAIAHSIVDRLRASYPCSIFFDIPYGAAAGALYSAFESGTLSDVSTLVRAPGAASGSALFADAFGHGEPILLDTSTLIWLRAIYGIRAADVGVRSPHSYDIRAVADSIMDRHDSRYDAPRS